MSKRVRSRDPTATDNDRDRDVDPEGIPLGVYREAERNVAGRYRPEREAVALEAPASTEVDEVSVATWLERSQEKMIDRVARQRRELLRDGDLLDHPVCDTDRCPCRLTPLELERSEAAGRTDDPRCRTCLSASFYDEFPPWVSPADRTVDRSVIETVQGV